MTKRYLGLDIGAESIKFVELTVSDNVHKCTRSSVIPHDKNPRAHLEQLLAELPLSEYAGGAVTGRLASIANLSKVPAQKALATGFLSLNRDAVPSTLVSVGAHGFAVLEIRDRDHHILRENGRCSQGTGNFLRQLVERFGLTVEESDELASTTDEGAPLSGRCPVILKTDMTHLANKGESRDRILAGLFDAVAENVEVLIKPALAPERVYLAGGVTRSQRFGRHMARFLKSKSMELMPLDEDHYLLYEALGAATEAYNANLMFSDEFLDGAFMAGEDESSFEHLPPLKNYMHMVHRIEAPPLPATEGIRDVILGFDMGSTGSKIIALDAQLKTPLWDHYTRTEGNPVSAAKRLVEAFLSADTGHMRVVAMGATGSGREITGSMLKSCYGDDRVFILNEIAAHARGATFYDAEVDTIFEIGGQDAKYIRLDHGEIFDSAMNEACSAGTGSFIEEQGSKFEGIHHVTDLAAIAESAGGGISLGQHCSVFMAEVIDHALGSGVGRDRVIAGIYDSIIQNYLNRVKGSRSVGKKIFCQGMPFASMALAAAAARQTGRQVVIPPSPGLVGALGIALLSQDELTTAALPPVDLHEFVKAELLSRDSFTCTSTKGCGGSGNRCRIDRLKVSVAGEEKRFIWGGSCSLYDRGARRGLSLPDRAPDPFRERKEMLERFVAALTPATPGPRVGVTEEFILKGLFPFFATLLRELGFTPVVITDATQSHLKRGIEEGNVPMCAPMQLYGGIISELAEKGVEHLFLPMLRDLSRVDDEPYATVCPLSQASSDILGVPLRDKPLTIHAPVIDMGEGNLRSRLFIRSVFEVAANFGVDHKQRVLDAYDAAYTAQRTFEREMTRMGAEALAFAREHNLPVIVVLGRAYTIYNDVLNSNVPRLLRELGAMAIPVDAYPVDDDVPVYKEVYWGYSQLNLRAAHQLRRTPNHYSVFCSNYSCGPDSFNLHFYSYIMDGKPYSIIETDGHSGDAGTKTRLEAFLYCVETDLKVGGRSQERPRKQLKLIELNSPTLEDVRRREDRLLFPRMGENAPIIAATLRGDGFKAESLPTPGQRALALGRKHSSGKECLPAVVTLGSLLERIEGAPPEERFAFFMPTANGPCRFGMYNMFHKMVIKELGLADTVSVVSQPDSDYFAGISKGLALKSFASFVFGDMLYEALLDTRPLETEKGAANRIYNKYYALVQTHLESTPAPNLATALLEIAGGMFGLRRILRDALREFAAVKDFSRTIPRVSVVGEIYVRLDPFSNDYVIERLEERGLGVKFAPFMEWLEYTDHINGVEIDRGRFPSDDGLFSRAISSFIQQSVLNRMYEMGVSHLKWPARTRSTHSIKASGPYIRQDLVGEAILTLGGPVHEFEEGVVHGVVSVGPLECMPNKIAEAQFFHVSERIGMPALTIALNGEPMDLETLDNFVYDVKRRFERTRLTSTGSTSVNRVAGI